MVKTLWQAARPYSYPASIVPVLIGSALAKLVFRDISFNLGDFILVLIGCIGAQAISNLVNDLFDFKTGVDNPESAGRTNFLVSGALTVKQMTQFVASVMIICAFIGLYFTLKIGWPMFWLVLISGLLAIEYTAPPLMLKYHALGDLTVFLTFGVAMVLGSYMVQTFYRAGWASQAHFATLFAYLLPSALLVVAILHANNHRDREKDAQYKGKTVANVLSFPASKSILIGLLVLPYGLVACAVLFGLISWFALIVLLTVPVVIQIIKKIEKDDYSMTVPSVAQLHGKFGVLMTVAILCQITFRIQLGM